MRCFCGGRDSPAADKPRQMRNVSDSKNVINRTDVSEATFVNHLDSRSDHGNSIFNKFNAAARGHILNRVAVLIPINFCRVVRTFQSNHAGPSFKTYYSHHYNTTLTPPLLHSA